VKDASKDIENRIAENMSYIVRMARLADDDAISYVTNIPKGAAQIVFGEIIIALPLADIIDLDQERARLSKESERVLAEIRKVDAKLSNESFVSRAPEDVIAEHRERKAEFEAMLIKLQAAQKSLAG
jgi:valyl-tRNA synthetase